MAELLPTRDLAGLMGNAKNKEKKQRMDETLKKSLPETKKRPIEKFAVKSFDYKIGKG